MTDDALILKTLAETLDIGETIKNCDIHQEDLKVVLFRAASRVSASARPALEDSLLTIFVDGASRGNPGPSGAGFAIYCDGKLLEGQAQYLGEVTNNQAEYNALILALERASELGGKKVMVKSDSELMVKQMRGEYKVKNEQLRGLSLRAFKLMKNFASFEIAHIPREENQEADRIANRAIDEFADDDD